MEIHYKNNPITNATDSALVAASWNPKLLLLGSAAAPVKGMVVFVRLWFVVPFAKA